MYEKKRITHEIMVSIRLSKEMVDEMNEILEELPYTKTDFIRHALELHIKRTHKAIKGTLKAQKV